MEVPIDVRDLLVGTPRVGGDEQAFPFLTTDEELFPHVALLSRAELDVSKDQHMVLAVIASPNTAANIERTGRAGLIAVQHEVAHYVKLLVARTLVIDGLLGCVLKLANHKRDTIGVPLVPIGFHTTATIARSERWDRSESMLRRLNDQL